MFLIVIDLQFDTTVQVMKKKKREMGVLFVAYTRYTYPVRAVRVVKLRIRSRERETETDTPKPSLPSASKEPIVP